MASDLKWLQTFGRLSTLTPSNYTHTSLSKPLILLSILILLANSAWKWESLQLGIYTKNSDRIHYAIFQFALWISYVAARGAFLLSARRFLNLYSKCEKYDQDFLADSVPSGSKCTNRFKRMALIFLNAIFIGQVLEFGIRHNYPSSSELARSNHCERVWLPCRKYDSIGNWLTVFFHVFDSLTLYYLSYFGIIMSSFLVRVVDHFQKGLLDKVALARGKLSNLDNVNLDLVTPLFILKQHGLRDKDKGKHGGQGEAQGRVEQISLHAQFSRIKVLFNSFNYAIGPPLIVSSFADILVFICVTYSFIPRLERGGFGPIVGVGGGSGYAPPGVNGMGLGDGDQEYLGGGALPPPPPFNSSDMLGHGVPFNFNETDTAHGFSYLPKLEYNEGHKTMIAIQITYVFAVLYEARTVLIAMIGSFLKYKIVQLKEELDDKIHEKSTSDGDKMWMSSKAEEEEQQIESVAARVQGWKWNLRPADMFNVDLSVIPTIMGTVMTYVVVLLQIQISEEKY